MSTTNGATSIHRYSHRHGNPVGEMECDNWFDSDGRLVRDAVMREALFHVGVVSSRRPCLWKFVLGIYPHNSTRRDQKTIDLENRANYNALRRRWQILDKTIQIPDAELTINDHPSYMEELSDDDTDDSIYPTQTEKLKLDGTKDGMRNHKLESLEANDRPEDVCSRCNKTRLSQCNSDITSSESGLSEALSALNTLGSSSTMSCECERFDQTPVSENLAGSETSNQTSCSDKHDGPTSGETYHQTLGSSTVESAIEETRNQTSSDSGSVVTEDGLRTKSCSCTFRGSCESLSKEDETLLQILDFPSRVYAARQPVQLETSYPKAKRVILRDVARTDRNYHYFTHNRNLRKVHRILMVYAMFHPEIGYAQGMNDILARFLVVTDSEVDSYWMFVQYMEQKKEDFLEHSMMRKVALVKKLVKEVDKELYMFFEKSDCCDYLFCHRWLLLDFKREFPFEDGLRMFEVLSSHYLELNSDKAIVETDKVIAKEFELDAGQTRSERSDVNLEFTFDLFVCVAILTMNSNDICKASDAAGIYGCLNGLSMNMSLREVLTQAEELFYKYCRQNITRGFAEIEL